MAEPSKSDPIHCRNHRLEVAVLPHVGGKIYDLIDTRSGQNFLWHNPRIPIQPYPVEANFDNYWCGGWDDGFPTCETCIHNGEVFPNLGELRSIAWTIDSAEPSEISLSAFGPITPVRARKRIRLLEDSLEMSFSIEHIGHVPIDFIWGTHPAYSITPDCILHIPATKGLVAQSTDPTLGEAGQTYAWPVLQNANGSIDMSRLLPPGKFSAGHYATEFSAGWYAVEWPTRGSGLLFEFPLELCPYLWLWLSYGGWRGYYVAVIEPWTSCPVTLTDAVSAGTHRILEPGKAFSCTVRATPWSKPETLQTLLERKGLS